MKQSSHNPKNSHQTGDHLLGEGLLFFYVFFPKLRIIDFSGQEKSRIYRAIALSFFKSLFSMFRMAAIYFVLLAFEKGELSMKPAWTALIFLGISTLGQFLLKMAADLQAVHSETIYEFDADMAV